MAAYNALSSFVILCVFTFNQRKTVLFAGGCKSGCANIDV